MEKLNLKRNKEDFYILEVNDNGDTIEFDLTDINLPNKILKASEIICNLDKEYQEKKNTLETNIGKDKETILKEIYEMEIEKCEQMRKAFDSFLGENACQKIFGDTNYYGMFLQLFDALEPHFKKMELKINIAKEKLANKYILNNDVM